jgi:hypothetical protein
MNLAGITIVRPAFRRRVVVLYAVITVIGLAVPALIAKPRGRLPHPIQQEARSTAHSATSTAPRR